MMTAIRACYNRSQEEGAPEETSKSAARQHFRGNLTALPLTLPDKEMQEKKLRNHITYKRKRIGKLEAARVRYERFCVSYKKIFCVKQIGLLSICLSHAFFSDTVGGV